jgi:hypothetical protein
LGDELLLKFLVLLWVWWSMKEVKWEKPPERWTTCTDIASSSSAIRK